MWGNSFSSNDMNGNEGDEIVQTTPPTTVSGDLVWKDILKNEDEVNGDLVFM